MMTITIQFVPRAVTPFANRVDPLCAGMRRADVRVTAYYHPCLRTLILKAARIFSVAMKAPLLVPVRVSSRYWLTSARLLFPSEAGVRVDVLRVSFANI